jgi:tripartite-type tricarboxylate transporter receptor subunit TctC
MLMKKIAQKAASWLAIAVTMMGVCSGSYAQNWPTKPVRIIAAFPPGTPGDLIARMIQPQLQAAWGQPVIVENKPGAAGNVGAAEVARAVDNHTLLVGPDTMLTINPHIYKKLSFSPLGDLEPITYMASFNQIFACHPRVGATNLKAVLKVARDDSFAYASGGAGSPSHMAMEMLLSATNSKMNHIAYRGPGPAMQDVLAGQVNCGFIVASLVSPHVKAGKVNALAVSGAVPVPSLPNVPTVADTVAPGFDAMFYEGMFAPRSMPVELREKVSRDVRAALSSDKIKKQLLESDLIVVASTPFDTKSRLNKDSQKWGAVALKIGLQLD